MPPATSLKTSTSRALRPVGREGSEGAGPTAPGPARVAERTLRPLPRSSPGPPPAPPAKTHRPLAGARRRAGPRSRGGRGRRARGLALSPPAGPRQPPTTGPHESHPPKGGHPRHPPQAVGCARHVPEASQHAKVLLEERPRSLCIAPLQRAHPEHGEAHGDPTQVPELPVQLEAFLAQRLIGRSAL